MPTPSAPLLPALIALYLSRCEVEGKSPRTVRAYRESLNRFLRTPPADDPPLALEAIDTAHVVRFLQQFAHLSHETRHRYFREVRCFFRWLREADYGDHDPFRGLRNVRLPQKVVQPFTPHDVRALLDACLTHTAAPASPTPRPAAGTSP